MDKSYLIRNLDDLGRIVLPPDIRAAMGWSKWTALEISVGDTGDHVTLKLARPSCFCCGGNDGLRQYFDKHICAACRKNICDL